LREQNVSTQCEVKTNVFLGTMVEKLKQIQNVLQTILSAGDELQTQTGVFQIYSKLSNELKQCKDMYEFLIHYPKINTEIKRLLLFCKPENDKRTNLNAIADALVNELKPRFVKESKRDDEIPLVEHIKKWLSSNNNLSIESDYNIVCGGFLAIFYTV
jgi:hypothetical protein